MRKYLSLIGLLVILISGMASSVLSADSWAVIIGISKYKDPNIPPTFCANNARALYDLLIDKAGFISGETIKLLVDEEATKAKIEEAIYGWLGQKAKEEDLVIIYYSGHGFPLPDADGDEKQRDQDDIYDECLSTYDMMIDNPIKAIPDDIFGYWLRRIRSRKIILFIDSCFSGGAAQSLSLPIGGALSAKSEEIGKGVVSDLERDGTFVLTASMDDEEAWQSRSLGESVFSHYLIEALRGGADAEGNWDGEISIGEVKDYVFKYVPEYYKRDVMVKKQIPTYNDKLGEDVIIISPEKVVKGKIIKVLSEEKVGLDLGRRDGMKEGDEYQVVTSEEKTAKLLKITEIFESRAVAEVVRDILPEVKLEEGLKIRRGWPPDRPSVIPIDEITAEVITSDNFDSQSLGDRPRGWDLAGGARADWSISDEYSYSKPNSLKITVTSTSAPGNAGVVQKQFPWPLSKDLTFEFSVLVAENNISHIVVGVKEGKARFMILFSNYGELCYHDSRSFNVVSTYSPNTWYDFKIIYHPSTDTHDLYLNGALQGSALSSPDHPRPAGDYFGVSFDTAGYLGGTTYLDDIRIYDSE